MNGSASAGPMWRPFRGIDPALLSEARLHAHYAVQWLARVAYAYVAPLPDDGHSNLGWDKTLDGFATHPMPDGAQLGLNVAGLKLTWLDGSGHASFSLDGRTDADVRAWLAERLVERGLSAEALNAALPYTIPPHSLTRDARYDASTLSDALQELAAWYANGDLSLVPLRHTMSDLRLDASEVRCWPHHFDLATLISFPAAKGQTGYVGVGLSPGDTYYGEPYFYVSAYPRPDPATLPALPKLGHWHSRDFTAGVAPAHRILASENPQEETEGFLKSAVEAAVKVLR